MPAGTIALTNNSTAVTGTGTSFTAELKANDFVVAVVGGVAYTLGIKSVDSNTALTLAQAYTGPAASGLAWTPVPFGTMTAITAQLAAQVTYAVRGFNLDKANWQQVYSASGNITVTLPDGSQYSGPSWNYISTQYASKLDKNQNLNDLADKKAARSNLELKGAAILDVGAAAGTVAAGDDIRITGAIQAAGGTMKDTLYSNTQGFSFQSNIGGNSVSSGASVNLHGRAYGRGASNYCQWDFYESIGSYFASRIVVANDAGAGNYSTFEFRGNGQGLSAAGWTTYSDKRLKTDVEIIDNPVSRLMKMRGYTYTKMGVRSTGVIAQEAQDALPEAVTNSGLFSTPEGEALKDVLTLSPGDLVGLLIEVCRNQEDRIEQRDTAITELQGRMKAIDGLDA